MEGPLDDRGPLQAAYDKGVGPWSLGLHQLAFCRQREGTEPGEWGTALLACSPHSEPLPACHMV